MKKGLEEKILTAQVLELVLVLHMDALFPTAWWISKRVNGWSFIILHFLDIYSHLANETWTTQYAMLSHTMLVKGGISLIPCLSMTLDVTGRPNSLNDWHKIPLWTLTLSFLS